MAKYAIVESGTVTNIVEWDGSATHADSSGWVLATADAQIGGSYDGSSFTKKPNTQTDADALTGMRLERDRRLSESDWTQGRDVTLTNDSDWQTYRQALRDLPSGKTTKAHVDGATWPTKPS
jgi:hypothetical protein|tara:strand:+ start:1811 stop:2176 length:366 start_codon:yes stop_codon:yes gene_type:complete